METGISGPYSSGVGTRVASPYTVDVDARTKPFAPTFRAASRSRNVATMFSSNVGFGSSAEDRWRRERARARGGARGAGVDHAGRADPHRQPEDRADDPPAHLHGERNGQAEGRDREALPPRLLGEEALATHLRLVDELPQER